MFLKADCQICCSKKSGTVGAIGDGAENTYNVQKLTRLGEKVHSSLKLCLCLILLASAPLRSQLDPAPPSRNRAEAGMNHCQGVSQQMG